MRDGRRSEPSALTRAVVANINKRLRESPLRSVHGLSKAVPSVSRSQLYLLLNSEAVMDMAELYAICQALGVSVVEVVGEAEAAASEPSEVEQVFATAARKTGRKTERERAAAAINEAMDEARGQSEDAAGDETG